mmetsp:Transcript_86447/g.201115  ORF Transcript_86447/g.201115 Transcript_86447/m.201115 type:complete len:215 (+) Transcript_86447:970-1614(+)
MTPRPTGPACTTSCTTTLQMTPLSCTKTSRRTPAASTSQSSGRGRRCARTRTSVRHRACANLNRCSTSPRTSWSEGPSTCATGKSTSMIAMSSRATSTASTCSLNKTIKRSGNQILYTPSCTLRRTQALARRRTPWQAASTSSRELLAGTSTNSSTSRTRSCVLRHIWSMLKEWTRTESSLWLSFLPTIVWACGRCGSATPVTPRGALPGSLGR